MQTDTAPSVSVRIRKDQYEGIKTMAAAEHRSVASQTALVIAAGLDSMRRVKKAS